MKTTYILKTAALLALSTGLSLQAQQKQLTTNTGAPVGDNQNSITVGQNGATLLGDINLVEKLAAFDRERIPERVVHARGAGAFGEFVAAGDFSQYTKAAFLSTAGKKTPIFVRFSTVIGSMGSPETVRDPRGFAIKFYTEQGNYDIVGNNTPVFFIRDAVKFPDMVHSLKPSPITNKQEPSRYFDFFSNVPESTHMLTILYTDFGTPANYRQAPGSGVHAFKWVNANGEVHYIKYTWKTLQGEKFMTAEEAKRVQGETSENATMDLYNSIKDGKFPAWDLYVQILKPEDMDKFDFNPLDPTKIWPEKLVPLTKIGTFTLNKNPDNFFESVEQAAFSPGTLVPGIEPSEDKLLQGRLFSYFDTQRYRIGANFQQLPVNAPKVAVNSNNQNGAFSNRNKSLDVNYQPSVSNEGYTDNATYKPSSTAIKSATISQQKIDKPNDFQQAGEHYRSLTEAMKVNLINNLTGDLMQVSNKKVVAKMVAHFYMADKDFGMRLAKSLKLSREEVEAAFMTK